MDWIVPAGFQKLKMYSLFLHCVCLCLSCIVIALLSCVSELFNFLLGQYLVLHSALLSCLSVDYCSYSWMFFPALSMANRFIHSFICRSFWNRQIDVAKLHIQLFSILWALSVGLLGLGSRVVIGHVTIRFPISHFLFTSADSFSVRRTV